ncbi:MAG: cytochrome c [Nitrospinae bacterium]|nr:cytochrome c [Nitrospinota bacterium]
MKKILMVFVILGIAQVLTGTLALAADPPKEYKKCKMCHKTDDDQWTATVGPGLKGIGKRASREYLEESLKDPRRLFDAGGPEIEAMKKWPKFKPALLMPGVIKNLTDEERKTLVEYLLTL